MSNAINDLIPIFGILAVFGVPAIVIILFARYRHTQRMELIRQGVNPDLVPPYPKQTSLFVGMLLLGLGIAMIASVILNNDIHLMLPGLLLIGAGIAYLLYWKLTASDRERVKRLFEERWASGAADTQIPMLRGHEAPVSVPRSETPDTAE